MAVAECFTQARRGPHSVHEASGQRLDHQRSGQSLLRSWQQGLLTMPPSQLLIARASESMVSMSRWLVGSSCAAPKIVRGGIPAPLAHSRCPAECMQVMIHGSQDLKDFFQHKCCHRGLRDSATPHWILESLQHIIAYDDSPGPGCEGSCRRATQDTKRLRRQSLSCRMGCICCCVKLQSMHRVAPRACMQRGE